MRYLIIYWIWIDYTISITIEILTYVISQKTYGQVFYSNKHKCVEKKIVENLFSFQKW
jgi:hypothetical protein